MKVLFGRKIARRQLEDYANSFCECNVRWVDAFDSTQCALQDVTEAFFLQCGPMCARLIENLKLLRIVTHIINVEQLSRLNCIEQDCVPFPFDAFIFQFFDDPFFKSLIDYSLANIHIARKRLRPHVTCTLHTFIPNNIHCNNVEKKFDVVFVGDATSTYRQTILQALKNVTVLQTLYGRGRDKLVVQHKILINAHYGASYRVLEELRCTPYVLAKTIVVSEDSLVDPKHPICKFIIFVPKDQICDTVQYVLSNYDFFFEMLFQTPLFHTLENDLIAYNATRQSLLLLQEQQQPSLFQADAAATNHYETSRHDSLCPVSGLRARIQGESHSNAQSDQ